TAKVLGQILVTRIAPRLSTLGITVAFQSALHADAGIVRLRTTQVGLVGFRTSIFASAIATLGTDQLRQLFVQRVKPLANSLFHQSLDLGVSLFGVSLG